MARRYGTIRYQSSAAGDHAGRILGAAFAVFSERGYAGTSTLEIATRAKVSKREIYALYRNKQGILAALIASRAGRMRAAIDLPRVRDLASLCALLEQAGAAILRTLCSAEVVAIFRLGIAEAARSPLVAKSLDEAGQKPLRGAVARYFATLQSQGLLAKDDPAALAEQYLALLAGNLRMRLLLGVAEAPSPADLEARARAAAAAFLGLYAAR
jgi:AcrR family transcriptional regulator